jgi:hypothetical protein
MLALKPGGIALRIHTVHHIVYACSSLFSCSLFFHKPVNLWGFTSPALLPSSPHPPHPLIAYAAVASFSVVVSPLVTGTTPSTYIVQVTPAPQVADWSWWLKVGRGLRTSQTCGAFKGAFSVPLDHSRSLSGRPLVCAV